MKNNIQAILIVLILHSVISGCAYHTESNVGDIHSEPKMGVITEKQYTNEVNPELFSERSEIFPLLDVAVNNIIEDARVRHESRHYIYKVELSSGGSAMVIDQSDRWKVGECVTVFIGGHDPYMKKSKC